jgi:hypothetical protein
VTTTVKRQLQQLDEQWYEEFRSGRGRPTLERVWERALGVRGRLGKPQASDEELFFLVYEALRYCDARFDERHPPKQGPSKLTPEARFLGYWTWKLRNLLKDQQKRLSRQWRRLGPLRGGVRKTVQQPESKTAPLAVFQALARLSGPERELIELRFLENETLEAIAAKTGFSDRHKASWQLGKALAKFRPLVRAELDDLPGFEGDGYLPLAAA